jgi:hypothetical protein
MRGLRTADPPPMPRDARLGTVSSPGPLPRGRAVAIAEVAVLAVHHASKTLDGAQERLAAATATLADVAPTGRRRIERLRGVGGEPR